MGSQGQGSRGLNSKVMWLWVPCKLAALFTPGLSSPMGLARQRGERQLIRVHAVPLGGGRW